MTVSMLRATFVALLVFAIIPPFIPILGPLSLDDVLPLAAVALASLVMLFSERPPRIDATIIGFTLLALLGVLSSAANAGSLEDFTRLAARSTGRVVFFLLLITATRFMLAKKPWPRRGMVMLAAAATIEALFCIYAYETKYVGPYGIGVIGFADWSVLKGSIRVQGTFSGSTNQFELAAVSANFLAAYLVMSTPVTLGLALSTERRNLRWLAFAAAAAQLIVLYLTYTRAALIALGVSILAMGWLLGRRKLAAALVALGVCATLAAPGMRAKFLGESHDRYALYWASLAITHDHPLLGVGDGNYERVLHDTQKYHSTPYGTAVTASHNSILLAAANNGIAGGLTLALLYVFVLLAGVRAVRRSSPSDRTLAAGVLAGLAGYLIQDQFNNLAFVPKVATQMWFMFAVLTELSDHPSEEIASISRATVAKSVRPLPLAGDQTPGS